MSPTMLTAPTRPTPLAWGGEAARQAELRHHAELLLSDVLSGAPPAHLTPDLARAMAQVAFAANSSGRWPLNTPLELFLALLAHEDLPEAILEWVIQDRSLRQPAAFAALLAHPACTRKVLLSAVRLILWHTHGAVDPDDWSFSHPLVPILRSSGHRGRCTALLLSLWADEDFEHFSEVLERLIDAPEPSLEILSTLADDLRLARRSRSFRISGQDLSRLVDQAVLLVAA